MPHPTMRGPCARRRENQKHLKTTPVPITGVNLCYCTEEGRAMTAEESSPIYTTLPVAKESKEAQTEKYPRRKQRDN